MCVCLAYKIMNISTTFVVNGATFSWKIVAAGSVWDPVPIDDLDEMIVCTLNKLTDIQVGWQCCSAGR